MEVKGWVRRQCALERSLHQITQDHHKFNRCQRAGLGGCEAASPRGSGDAVLSSQVAASSLELTLLSVRGCSRVVISYLHYFSFVFSLWGLPRSPLPRPTGEERDGNSGAGGSGWGGGWGRPAGEAAGFNPRPPPRLRTRRRRRCPRHGARKAYPSAAPGSPSSRRRTGRRRLRTCPRP